MSTASPNPEENSGRPRRGSSRGGSRRRRGGRRRPGSQASRPGSEVKSTTAQQGSAAENSTPVPTPEGVTTRSNRSRRRRRRVTTTTASHSTAKPAAKGGAGRTAAAAAPTSTPSTATTAQPAAENSATSQGGAQRKRRRRRSRSSQQGQAGQGQAQAQRRGQQGAAEGRRRTRKRGGRKAAAKRTVQMDLQMPVQEEVSAGGMVVSGLSEAVGAGGKVDTSVIYVALIGRTDRRRRLLWSIPKGHVEPGEGIEATAEREVWEETGLHGKVIAKLGVIDYWFVSEGVRIHKTVHHHLLRYVDGIFNNEDPEVTEVTWVPLKHLVEHLVYSDERNLARKARQMIPDLARAEHATGRLTPR